jgi:hypothetical protein
MTSRLVLALMIGVGHFSVAYAAGPYDGRWTAQAPQTGNCSETFLSIDIVDGALRGNVGSEDNLGTVAATSVAPDGTAKIAFGSFGGTLQLSGESLRGTVKFPCGEVSMAGSRLSEAAAADMRAREAARNDAIAQAVTGNSIRLPNERGPGEVIFAYQKDGRLAVSSTGRSQTSTGRWWTEGNGMLCSQADGPPRCSRAEVESDVIKLTARGKRTEHKLRK